MKGIVFTEFLEFVEQQYSPNIVDNIIDASNLSTDGAYTSVGTYDCEELLQLVSALSKETQTPSADLVCAFGQHLFKCLATHYPQFIEGVNSTFDFLQSIHSHIHVEVHKLYPDAELPTFKYTFPLENQMVMHYQSKRPLADLAEGLIRGSIEYFGEKVVIQRENDLSDNTSARFILTLQA